MVAAFPVRNPAYAQSTYQLYFHNNGSGGRRRCRHRHQLQCKKGNGISRMAGARALACTNNAVSRSADYWMEEVITSAAAARAAAASPPRSIQSYFLPFGVIDSRSTCVRRKGCIVQPKDIRRRPLSMSQSFSEANEDRHARVLLRHFPRTRRMGLAGEN